MPRHTLVALDEDGAMTDVEVVLANNDRVTVRVGDLFLKIDADHDRGHVEFEALERAPVPTPEVVWHQPPVLALKALAGQTLGKLGEQPTATPAAWAAVGAALRVLHDAPPPARTGPTIDDLRAKLDASCTWLRRNAVLSADVIEQNRRRAERVLRPHEARNIHGDLHLEHVFVDGDEVTGIIDWSEARQGDPLFDLASLTLGNERMLNDLLLGYGEPVDRTVVEGWWSFRCLTAIRWLQENGYGEAADLPEAEILRSITSP